MPKHIIEFNLPEEESELKLTLKAVDMHLVLYDFMNILRTERKYGENRWEEVETKFLECCSSREVDPYEG